MMKKIFYNVVGMFVLSLMVCSAGFAVELPDGVTPDPNLSGQDGEALKSAKNQLSILKQQLMMMAQAAPPDQQTMINGVIAKVEDKLERIDRIDVCFVPEDEPGEAYGDIYEFYKGTLSEWQDVESAEVQFAVTQAPPGMIPPATLESLEDLLASGSVKAAAGTLGKSRVSILTVYLDPTTLKLIEGTTIVIATDK